jgi:hypothetical protein
MASLARFTGEGDEKRGRVVECLGPDAGASGQRTQTLFFFFFFFFSKPMKWAAGA